MVHLPIGSRPIGLFDSGVGGLTIWREVARRLPAEDLVYFADQAHCPYGARAPEEIRALSRRAADFLIVQGCKIIVVACNTASAAALGALRAAFRDVSFIGMEPAIKPAADLSLARKIGVLATRGTLAGDLFAHTRSRLSPDVEIITQTADGLVERIEAGEADSPETEQLLRRYVEPLRNAGVDTLVLGCTHYPFVSALIRRIAGEGIELIDPSGAVAAQVVRVLDARGWRNESTHLPAHRFYTSGDPQIFERLIEKLIGVRASAERAGD